MAEEGISRVQYAETDHYLLTRQFLNNPQAMLDELLRDDEGRRRTQP
jgi:predicted ATPase